MCAVQSNTLWLNTQYLRAMCTQYITRIDSNPRAHADMFFMDEDATGTIVKSVLNQHPCESQNWLLRQVPPKQS